MKTAISIPDEVFERAERVAKRLRKSRSELYADALAEYLARREPSEVTAAIDAVLVDDDATPDRDDFSRAAARKAFSKSEW